MTRIQAEKAAKNYLKMFLNGYVLQRDELRYYNDLINWLDVDIRVLEAKCEVWSKNDSITEDDWAWNAFVNYCQKTGIKIRYKHPKAVNEFNRAKKNEKFIDKDKIINELLEEFLDLRNKIRQLEKRNKSLEMLK